MERLFLVKYNTGNNYNRESIFIKAGSLVEAQNKFFEWLRSQNCYYEMWSITVNFEEVKEKI